MGMGKADVERYGFVVTDGNAAAGQTRPSAAGHDAAIIRIQVRNVNTGGYRSKDPATGANPARLNPRTGKPWGAEDPCVLFPDVNPACTDDGRLAAGARPGSCSAARCRGRPATCRSRRWPRRVLADHAVARRHPGGDA